MAQYIDKDRIAAEIKRRIKEIDEMGTYLSPKGTLINLLCSLDTLEVKEVDLDEEIEKFLKKHNMLAIGKKDFTEIAKHFFELGVAVSNKAQEGE